MSAVFKALVVMSSRRIWSISISSAAFKGSFEQDVMSQACNPSRGLSSWVIAWILGPSRHSLCHEGTDICKTTSMHVLQPHRTCSAFPGQSPTVSFLVLLAIIVKDSLILVPLLPFMYCLSVFVSFIFSDHFLTSSLNSFSLVFLNSLCQTELVLGFSAYHWLCGVFWYFCCLFFSIPKCFHKYSCMYLLTYFCLLSCEIKFWLICHPSDISSVKHLIVCSVRLCPWEASSLLPMDGLVNRPTQELSISPAASLEALSLQAILQAQEPRQTEPLTAPWTRRSPGPCCLVGLSLRRYP